MARWQGFYDELAQSRYPALLAYATALTGQRATAEDLVHDALIRTFSSARKLTSAHHAENYVRRAIVTIFLDRVRREAKHTELIQRVDVRLHEPDRSREVDDRDRLHAALAELSPQVRTCIVLRFYDDLTLAETAAQMKLSVGTVKRYVFDGTRALEKVLGPHESHDLTDDRPRTTRVTVSAAPARKEGR